MCVCVCFRRAYGTLKKDLRVHQLKSVFDISPSCSCSNEETRLKHDNKGGHPFIIYYIAKKAVRPAGVVSKLPIVEIPAQIQVSQDKV